MAYVETVVGKVRERHIKFVEAYLVSLNAKAAAIEVGFPEKTAKSQASRLLKTANVRKYLEHRREELSKNTNINELWVIERLKRIADCDIDEVLDNNHLPKTLSEIKPEQRYAIQEISTKKGVTNVKLASKQRALETIANILGMMDRKEDKESSQTIFQIVVEQ